MNTGINCDSEYGLVVGMLYEQQIIVPLNDVIFCKIAFPVYYIEGLIYSVTKVICLQYTLEDADMILLQNTCSSAYRYRSAGDFVFVNIAGNVAVAEMS
jgi:hypothetical protein